MFSRLIDLHRSITDELHQGVLTAMNNLALVYYKQGRLEEAEILHRETLEGREKALGDEHFETILSKMNLAYTLTERENRPSHFAKKNFKVGFNRRRISRSFDWVILSTADLFSFARY